VEGLKHTSWRIAWGHAQALLKGLRGQPLEPQAKGLVKALEQLKGDWR
jgi:hypothetical protein